MNQAETALMERMTLSLKIARAAWEKADMPRMYPNLGSDTAKVGIATIAVKIFDHLGQKEG